MIDCISCGKKPTEISEYISEAKKEGISPEDFVRCYEGTFNRKTEKFHCTECYIKSGMPLGVVGERWRNEVQILNDTIHY
jgi:hypothetical protein